MYNAQCTTKKKEREMNSLHKITRAFTPASQRRATTFIRQRSALHRPSPFGPSIGSGVGVSRALWAGVPHNFASQRRNNQFNQNNGRTQLSQLAVRPGGALVQQRGVAGPAARMAAQLLVMVGGIFGRAFMQAFAQAKANAAKNGGAEAAGEAAKSVLRRGEMEINEAYEILNVDRGEVDSAKINEQFDKYFTANDPQKGGSLYLQSKVFRAKEAIDAEMKREQEEKEKAAGGQ